MFITIIKMAAYGVRARTSSVVLVKRPAIKLPSALIKHISETFSTLRVYNTVHETVPGMIPVQNEIMPHYKFNNHLTLDDIGNLIVLTSCAQVKQNFLVVKFILAYTMALPINLSKKNTWLMTMTIKATKENKKKLYDHLLTNLAPNGATTEYETMLDLLKFVTDHEWESKIHGSNDEDQNTAAKDIFNLLRAVYQEFVSLNLKVAKQEVSTSNILDVIKSVDKGEPSSQFDKNFDEMMEAEPYSSWVDKSFNGDFKAAIRSIEGNKDLPDDILVRMDADFRSAERGEKPVQPEESSDMSMGDVGQGFRNKTVEPAGDNRWTLRLELIPAIMNGSPQTFLRATGGQKFLTVDGNNRGHTYAAAVTDKQMSYAGTEVFLNPQMLHSISKAKHRGDVFAPHQAVACRGMRSANAIQRPLPQMNTTIVTEVLTTRSKWSAATAKEQLQAVMRPIKEETDADDMVKEHPATKKFDRSLLTKAPLTGHDIGELLSMLFLKGLKARAQWAFLRDASEVGRRYYAANQVSAIQVSAALLVINQAGPLNMYLLTNTLAVDESDLNADRLVDFDNLWALYGKVAQVAFAFQKKQKSIEHGSTLSDLCLSRIYQKCTEFIYLNTERTQQLRLNDAYIEKWVEFFVVFDNKYLDFLWTKEMSAPENKALCESGQRVLRSMHADDLSLTNKTVGQTALRRLASFLLNTQEKYYKSRELYMAQVQADYKAAQKEKRPKDDVASASSSNIPTADKEKGDQGGATKRSSKDVASASSSRNYKIPRKSVQGGATKRSRNDLPSASSSDIQESIDIDELNATMSAQQDPSLDFCSGSEA